MFETVDIEESFGAPKKVGRRWLVTVAVPGKGSKGNYSEEALRNSGPASFPPGTKAFFKHAAPQDRDPRDQVGTYPEGAFWNEAENKLQAILDPFPRYEVVLEEAGTSIEASIHAKALKDMRGNIHSLIPDRANSIDLVAFAGLEGSGLQYQVESLFSAVADETVDSVTSPVQEDKKGTNMEITETMWNEVKTDVRTLVTTLNSFVEESLTKAKGEADEAVVADLVESRVSEALSAYVEQEKAINDAGLLPPQVEALKARALKGEDITESLVEAKAIVEAARTSFTPEPTGRGKVVTVTESSSNPGEARKFSGWSRN